MLNEGFEVAGELLATTALSPLLCSLSLAPNTVTIIDNPSSSAWEDKLASLFNVAAVRLDDEHIAVQVLI